MSSVGFGLDAQQRANAAMKPQQTPETRALEGLIQAWDALPGGQYHSPWDVEQWLKKQMGPAVSRARKALKEAQPS